MINKSKNENLKKDKVGISLKRRLRYGHSENEEDTKEETTEKTKERLLKRETPTLSHADPALETRDYKFLSRLNLSCSARNLR